MPWNHAWVSTSAAQATAFYTEAIRHGAIWGIRDAGGFPAPEAADGRRAMPFWSSRSRADRVIATVPAYTGFEPTQIPLTDFRTRWLPGLARDGLRVGINWSGERATGFDLEAREVEDTLAAAERPTDPGRR